MTCYTHFYHQRASKCQTQTSQPHSRAVSCAFKSSMKQLLPILINLQHFAHHLTSSFHVFLLQHGSLIQDILQVALSWQRGSYLDHNIFTVVFAECGLMGIFWGVNKQFLICGMQKPAKQNFSSGARLMCDFPFLLQWSRGISEISS